MSLIHFVVTIDLFNEKGLIPVCFPCTVVFRMSILLDVEVQVALALSQPIFQEPIRTRAAKQESWGIME